MRAAVILAALALQLGAAPHSDLTSEPNFQPYQRAVLRNKGTGSQTCVALDATVLAHTGTRTGNDLRLYAQSGAQQQETPYALTESSAEPGDTETIAISGERVHGSDVEFDLHMPSRAYSEIDLFTGLKDFIALAQVSGSETSSGHGRSLGTLTLFNFSGQGLPASTQLPLAEASFPWLHIHLRFMNEQGGPLSRTLRTPVFTEAQVPPSRQAQVLYTPVASTESISNDGYWTHATLEVPEHVPVDRVSVELAPSFHGDFLREISVGARPVGNDAPRGTVLGMAESVAGSIARLTRGSLGPGVPPIHFDQLHLPVVLGSNLRSPAQVALSVHNVLGGKILPALSIQRVVLEMRRRSLCFEARNGSDYMLRYGDPRLPAPAYEYARTFELRSDAHTAQLGSEEHNPEYKADRERKRLLTRSPELVWLGVIAVIAVAGILAVERLRGRKHLG